MSKLSVCEPLDPYPSYGTEELCFWNISNIPYAFVNGIAQYKFWVQSTRAKYTLVLMGRRGFRRVRTSGGFYYRRVYEYQGSTEKLKEIIDKILGRDE